MEMPANSVAFASDTPPFYISLLIYGICLSSPRHSFLICSVPLGYRSQISNALSNAPFALPNS
jgi:hypothetical protein